jgi:hypothetical protein
MVTFDNSNESRTSGCLRTNRLFCVSFSLVLLIAVAILFPNLFNEEYRWNQSSVYSSSPYNEDSKASFLKELSGSTDKGSKSKIHTHNKIMYEYVWVIRIDMLRVAVFYLKMTLLSSPDRSNSLISISISAY